MFNKHCPYCQQTITLDQLKSNKSYRSYSKREPFPCPHCQESIQLPEQAETLRSVGLLFSVIVAPLLYYWQAKMWISYGVFAVGIMLLLLGIKNNVLQKVPGSTTHVNEEHEKK